jgi:molybdopterin molybdotransferase
MLTIVEALEAVLDRAVPLAGRPTALADALGCALAEDVAADIDMPPFDKALMDGYAVRASDLAGGDRRLAIGEEITAGRTPTRPLGPREAASIMTGAPIPVGADAVVMVERTRREGEFVIIDDPDVSPGRNRLQRGREMRAGEIVLTRGTALNAPRLGLLAAVGRPIVSVVPRPKVIVVSTGDELVEPGQVPGPGQIRNSNATMQGALAAASGAEVESLPIVPDEPESLRQALARGLAADVLIITGGVSAGNRDLVPATLEALRVERVFHKVRLKPGKPLWFGVAPTRRDGSPAPLVFGLPGNPVSGVVGFLLFVRPALDVLAGRAGRADRSVPARLSRPFNHSGDRPTYHPSRVFEATVPGHLVDVEPLDWAGSADLRTVARADGFAIFPAGDRAYAPGEIVRFLPLG